MSSVQPIPASGIVIGAGAPNDTKHGKTFCAIVLTKEMGLIRVYPIPAEQRLPVWATVEIKIEKGSDYRPESFRLISFSLTGKIEDADAKREILNSCVIKSGHEDPMDFQNTNRASIFLTKLEWGQCGMTIDQRVPNIAPDDDEHGWIITQGRHWLKPYLTWTSEQGKEHKSHMGGREIYEGLRNNPVTPFDLFNNLQVMNPDYERWVLMGNMKDRPNVWLCVHLHRLKKSNGGSTPLFSHPIIGSADGWPYMKQEDSNVRIVDGHPDLFTTSDTIPSFSRGITAKAI